MLRLPSAPAPDAAALPGFAVIRRFIVPVKEFAPLAVLAASFTAASGLAAAVDELAEPELAELPQPVTAPAAATATASMSPVLRKGRRALTARTVNLRDPTLYQSYWRKTALRCAARLQNGGKFSHFPP